MAKDKFMTKRLLIVIALVGMGTLMIAGCEAPNNAKSAGEKLPSDRLEKLDEKLLHELKLTQKQDVSVRKILISYRQEMAEWSQKNTLEMKKLQQRIAKVHQGRNTEPIKDIRIAAQKLRNLQAEQKKLSGSLIDRLKGVLNKAQLTKARNILHPTSQAPPFYLLKRLDLTKKQKVRIDEIQNAARSETMKAGKADGNFQQKA